MAIWDNQSEATKNKILEGLRAFDKILRRDKRKEKIEMFCAPDPNIVVMGGPSSNKWDNMKFNPNIGTMFRSQERIKKIRKIFDGKIQKEEVRF